jgi:hypothetical protein
MEGCRISPNMASPAKASLNARTVGEVETGLAGEIDCFRGCAAGVGILAALVWAGCSPLPNVVSISRPSPCASGCALP